MNEEKFINLYSPVSYHEEQYIVADKASLLKLKQAIDEALEDGVGVKPMFASDGEGHFLVVALDECVDDVQVAYRHDWVDENALVPQFKEDAQKLFSQKIQGAWGTYSES